MGKHHRAHKAEQLKKERVKKRAILGSTVAALGIAGLIAAGAIRGGDGTESSASGSQDKQELGEDSPAREAIEEYVSYFGCSVAPESISVSVVSNIAPEDGGEAGSVALARTLKTGEIEIASYVPEEDHREIALHEVTHACANVAEPNMLAEPLRIDALGETIIGFRGFRAMFAPGPQGADAEFILVEEGLAELLSTNFEGHKLSSTPSYAGSAQTLRAIAEYRNISHQTLSALQQDSDFMGLIALVKNKPKEEVNTSDISDIMYLFGEAATEGKAPSSEDLAFMLNFVTTE